jgi:site-specific DNA recombinase
MRIQGPGYAAIYARVSTEDQGKGFSIPTQLEACQKLADREGYAVPETNILIDEGISGTTMERPGLRKVRALVNAKAVTAVIVYDPDRLSRNLGHQLLLAEEFEQAHVKLLIVSHPMEQGPEGWLFFQMRGALAEYERAKILERTQRGRLGRAKAGYVNGGRVPLGYRYVPTPRQGTLVIDEEEATLVRQMFAWALQGLTMRAIARRLTDTRIPTATDRRAYTAADGRKPCKQQPVGVWSISSVSVILTNPAYMGQMRYYARANVRHNGRRVSYRWRPQEEWLTVPVPAIIDPDTFTAVQRQLEDNRHRRPPVEGNAPFARALVSLWALWPRDDSAPNRQPSVLPLQFRACAHGAGATVSRDHPRRHGRVAGLGCRDAAARTPRARH